MPFSSLHRVKKSKNYAILAVLLLLMVIFFMVTMMRMNTPVHFQLSEESRALREQHSRNSAINHYVRSPQ